MDRLKPEEAQELLVAIATIDFMSVECDKCGRFVGDHTDEEVRACLGQV
jgi:hypothetical protein